MLNLNHLELFAAPVDSVNDDRRYFFQEWPFWKSPDHGDLCYKFADRCGSGNLDQRDFQFYRDKDDNSLTHINYDGVEMCLVRVGGSEWLLRGACDLDIVIQIQGWCADTALLRLNDQQSCLVRMGHNQSLMDFIATFARGIASALSLGRVRRSRYLCLFVDDAPQDRDLAARLVVACSVWRIIFSSSDFTPSVG